MKKLIVNVWLILVSVMVSFSWLLVYPGARYGTVGDVVWLVLALLVFVVLRLSAGGFRRFMMLFCCLSILAALLALLWPSDGYMFTRLGNGSDAIAFLLSFTVLFVLAMVMSPVRRMLHMQRAR